MSASSVRFTPGARTAWHTHPNGQTIYVTEGVGLTQHRGGPIEVIRPGDRVFFEPGEDHWHGAAPTRFMTHIAMLDVDDKGTNATWGDHVSDTEYAAAPSMRTHSGDAPMTPWTSVHLDKIGRDEEVQIASIRRDGTLSKPVTVWAVRNGDDVYVRAVGGRKGQWFRGTQERHEGRIQAGRVQQDVAFVDAEEDVNQEVDAAYRAKYGRYAGSILNSVLTPQARAATMKLVPRFTSA